MNSVTKVHVGTLPPGARGFDANGRITRAAASGFHQAGYSFAVRYVRREARHTYDVTSGEIIDLLTVGLGVMLVQHVAPPGWMPTRALGHVYGSTAAIESAAVGLPKRVTVWCDLEGVSGRARGEDVIAYCNAWFDEVSAAGYEPGLYVGDACGLTATELYRRLRFARYWSAYNLNRDNYPAERGVQMRQYVAAQAERVGVPFDFDVNVIRADAKGGLPTLLLPASVGRPLG